MPKKPVETIPALVKRVMKEQAKSQPKPLARGRQMDVVDKIAAAASRANCSIESWIMTQPGARFEPQPSERNAMSEGGTLADLNADMTFARGGQRYGHTPYMRSRRVG